MFKKFFISGIFVMGLVGLSVPTVSAFGGNTVERDGGTWQYSGYGNYQCTSNYYHRGRRHSSTAIGHNKVVSKKPALQWTYASAKPWSGHNEAFYGFY